MAGGFLHQFPGFYLLALPHHPPTTTFLAKSLENAAYLSASLRVTSSKGQAWIITWPFMLSILKSHYMPCCGFVIMKNGVICKI